MVEGFAAEEVKMELTFLMLKPDAVRRRLIGDIVRRFEHAGYAVHAMKVVVPERATVEAHYAEHVGKAFYRELIDFMSSGPVVPIIVSRDQLAVVRAREIIGTVGSIEPGTIRGDYNRRPVLRLYENLIHSSDSPEAVTREIALWFPDYGSAFREE